MGTHFESKKGKVQKERYRLCTEDIVGPLTPTAPMAIRLREEPQITFFTVCHKFLSNT